jgi:predicted O-linked N-acetylglucosamine transferase (SPINDLY family)
VGRGAASQLTAIGLPELITPTLKDYAQTAIDLASDGGRLNAIRAKLTENKSTSTLFNTGLFTRRIEAAYLAIYERRQAGASPDHIFAPS